MVSFQAQAMFYYCLKKYFTLQNVVKSDSNKSSHFFYQGSVPIFDPLCTSTQVSLLFLLFSGTPRHRDQLFKSAYKNLSNPKTLLLDLFYSYETCNEKQIFEMLIFSFFNNWAFFIDPSIFSRMTFPFFLIFQIFVSNDF